MLDDPILNEAKERLNLLLVSYLSAPHYSALPAQDQECIDRETVNAFLLDERFKQNHASSTTSTRKYSLSTQRDIAPRNGSNSNSESGIKAQTQPKVVMLQPAPLIFLGLCSIAFLGPHLPSHYMTDLIASFVPDAVASWPGWGSTSVRTTGSVVALTSLTALFARTSSSRLRIASFSAPSNAKSANGEEGSDQIIRELRKLFNICKRFIDECTRLDITLEKAFTVLSELDRLAGLDENEGHEEFQAEDGDNTHYNRVAPTSGSDNGNWQDLTTIEARLSASHPRQYQPSLRKRMPALPVRRAIFASLYTTQERLEKDIDALASTFHNTTSDSSRKDEQEDIDVLELVRLLDMYNCHPIAQPLQGIHATSQQDEDEEAAERLYRRTMARRSLSPTLYTEQQQQAQSFNAAAAKLKRRSGMYGPPSRSSSREDAMPLKQTTSAVSAEEHLARRASWAAFQPSQRGQVHPHNPHPQATQAHVTGSPSSLHHSRALTSLIATPPRARPQSIHFGGGIPSSSANMVAVTSSPLANGAKESNSTIKRERRRRSEQLFSLNTQNLQAIQPSLAEDGPLRLQSSTSSTASATSSIGSLPLKMSTSSQGTSADPVTAASMQSDLYASPSRFGHSRRTSLGPAAGPSALHKQHNRRSRPLSMHELDFGRSIDGAPIASLHGDSRRTSLDEVPEADSTALHRNAAAAALERRWSTHSNATHPSILSASSSTASLRPRQRERPASLLLQSSPILSSPAPRRSPEVGESPAASFRSRRAQHHQHQQRSAPQPRSKFAVDSLREGSDKVSRLERALVCHLLAIKYSSNSSRRLELTLSALIKTVEGLNACINVETTTLSQTMWEEFEGTSQAKVVEPGGTTAPAASVLLATPVTSGLPFQSTPKRSSLIACLPGSYPSSPVIEVDPATPPSDSSTKQTPQGSYFRQFDDIDVSSEQEQNFAPRDPFSAPEKNGRAALAESHVELNAALRSIATKMYMERQDLKDYFQATQSGSEAAAVQHHLLQQLEARQESLRLDLQGLLRAWEDGRVSLRQIKLGQQRRIAGPTSGILRRQMSSEASDYDDAEGEPSLMSASAELRQHGSISSVLSSGNEDSLSTPAVSPVSQAVHQPVNISELLLDSVDPAQLPRYGMQEQLYEAYVGQEDGEYNATALGKGKLSREERIALAKAKRAETRERPAQLPEPQANADLINELKDMVALLRYVQSSACNLYRTCTDLFLAL